MFVIRTVQTRTDLKDFIGLPYALYRNDPVWIPPLRSEQNSQFDVKRNPFLNHCTYALFLLEDKGRLIGRIAAFIDNVAIEFWKEPIGLFGYYECIENDEASRLMLDTALQWLRQRGMKAMRGPWSFVSQEWGMVKTGFTPSPVVMAPYNPPYYNDQLIRFGFHKIKDLLCYYLSGKEGYHIPDRILTLTDDVINRYGIKVRQINMKHFKDEVQKIFDLSNRCLIGNWGYTPVTREEAEAVAHDLRPIIHARGVLFAEDSGGRPVGFAIALPDINVLLKGLHGRLFPTGLLKMMFGLPRLRNYRLFALGVIPEYHGKGIDSLIYRALYESLYTPEIWMEINYVLEDNAPMNNAIRKLDAKPLRIYRIYERSI